MSSEADGAAVLSPGEVLKDRYVIEREIGRGGFGADYLARAQQLLSKPVVVKVLLGEASRDSWIQRKFQQELEALARIDHPGVVGILDVGIAPAGQAFLVMQFVEGVTLRSVIQSGGIDLARAAPILRQIGQALEAAHEKGVVHRDLKPENVMLLSPAKGEEYVKLIDFGIAAVKHSQVAENPVSSKIAGTFAYMAPEQLMGKPSPASDVYSFGVIAFEMLTGQRPELQPQGVKTPPRELRPELPEAAQSAILKALSFHVEERYGSPRMFGEHLATALTSGATATPISAAAPAAASSVAAATVIASPQRAAPSTPGQPPSLEMAYVLFTDLVGYSMLPMDQQTRVIQMLQEIVRATPEFQRAHASEQLICLPTGDGMALVFFQNPVAAVQCAVEVARSLRSHPDMKLRMGVHTGPVHRIPDINTNRNVSGGGINLAQRVMDCGDAGHILVSKSVADILSQLSDWAQCLHDLGEHEVKHGTKVHLVNLHTPEVGNPEIPEKLRRRAEIPQAPKQQPKSRRGVYMLAGAALTIIILVFAGTQVANWRRAAAKGAPSRTEALTSAPAQRETGAARNPASSPSEGPAAAGTGSVAQQPPLTEQAKAAGSLPPADRSKETSRNLPPAATAGSASSPFSQTGGPKVAAQFAPVQDTSKAAAPPARPAIPAAASQARPVSPEPQTAASEAEMEALQDRFLKLSARANTTKSAVERLRQQQARMGLGLRGDMATALDRQEFLLNQVDAAFNARDASRMKRQLDLAEKEVEKLERFLGM